MEAIYQRYQSYGFIVVSAFGENTQRGTPSQSELVSWANYYGHTFPVMSDPSWGVGGLYNQDGAHPTLVLMEPGMRIVTVDQRLSESDIQAALPTSYP
ncbi:MAG: hypothetical protein H6741_29105 [Alphaproteobacteria bacterium]|nr:hypothetical protein [Alphaproteobacteria bacterium]MCB9796778.1 hypothetical protein [Alphaproteobacteria bacterium]